MNILALLPLLEGWTDAPITISEVIEKTPKLVYDSYAVKAKKEEVERGWLTGMDCLMDDAFGAMKIQYGSYITGWVCPYYAYLYGLVYPPPVGSYYCKYSQPAPPSTAGFYVMSAYVGAYPTPFKGRIQIWFKLDDLSTQVTATNLVTILRVEIDDLELFKRSLKEVLRDIGMTKLKGSEGL